MGRVLVLESLVRSSFIIGWFMVYGPWCCFGEDCVMYYFGIDFNFI